MCSWCWGFAPEIERLSAHLLEHHPNIPLDVVVGGLRPGPNAQPLDARLAGFLRSEWTRINQATGQPFSFDTLDRKDWRYDTEVPAAAVALAREVGLAPVLKFMAAIQRAFYADAVDVTSILTAADAIITDYSSVAFDYAVLERPVIFHPYDIDEYLSIESGSFTIDYDELAGTRRVRSADHLADVIRTDAWRTWQIPEHIVRQIWGTDPAATLAATTC